MTDHCKACGSERRYITSVASTGSDDVYWVCDCPTDWTEVLAQVIVCSLLVGLFVTLGLVLR